MTDKECVIQILQGLPDSASIEDIRYEIETILSVLEGQRDIAEGRTYSHEEVREMAQKCLSKYIGQGSRAAT